MYGAQDVRSRSPHRIVLAQKLIQH